MDLNQMMCIDPNILLGVVNEKLRIECASLAELVAMFDLDEAQLKQKMCEIGYHYDALSNQFKAV